MNDKKALPLCTIPTEIIKPILKMKCKNDN